MMVNAFWFGFLIGILVTVVLLFVIAFLSFRNGTEEDEDDDFEQKRD